MEAYGHRSLPQIAALSTRTTASAGWWIFGSGRSSTRMSPAPYITAARIRCLLFGGCALPAAAERAAPKVWDPHASLGREADPLRELYPWSCRGDCWPLSCRAAWLSCAGLVAQLASRLSASCDGESGSVV